MRHNTFLLCKQASSENKHLNTSNTNKHTRFPHRKRITGDHDKASGDVSLPPQIQQGGIKGSSLSE